MVLSPWRIHQDSPLQSGAGVCFWFTGADVFGAGTSGVRP